MKKSPLFVSAVIAMFAFSGAEALAKPADHKDHPKEHSKEHKKAHKGHAKAKHKKNAEHASAEAHKSKKVEQVPVESAQPAAGAQ